MDGLVDHSRGPGPLTAREARVLELMADGWSNGAIAARLTVSPRTVETHVRSIYLKLGLSPGGAIDRRVLAVLAWRAAGGAGPTVSAVSPVSAAA